MTAIPITVLTGFLGSGKTTLLKRLLTDPAMAGTAVIINEFGDVALDDALIETASDDTVLLPSGCVCCAVRGDLVKALERLHQQWQDGNIPRLDRIVLETSGLADPGPIAHTVMTEEAVYRLYGLDGIVTTVDAELGAGQIAAEFEPAKQIAIADRIVLTKTDRATPAQIAATEARIRAINRSVPIIRAVKGDLAAAELIGLGAHEPVLGRADPVRWLGADVQVSVIPAAPTLDQHTHPTHAVGEACTPDCNVPPAAHGHLHGITSFNLTYDTPLDGQGLTLALQTLAGAYGDRLLRIKGILHVTGQELPIVVHAVQHLFYPLDRLEAWPSADRRSRLVIIARDLTPDQVIRHFKPFFGLPGQS